MASNESFNWSFPKPADDNELNLFIVESLIVIELLFLISNSFEDT